MVAPEVKFGRHGNMPVFDLIRTDTSFTSKLLSQALNMLKGEKSRSCDTRRHRSVCFGIISHQILGHSQSLPMATS